MVHFCFASHRTRNRPKGRRSAYAEAGSLGASGSCARPKELRRQPDQLDTPAPAPPLSGALRKPIREHGKAATTPNFAAGPNTFRGLQFCNSGQHLRPSLVTPRQRKGPILGTLRRSERYTGRPSPAGRVLCHPEATSNVMCPMSYVCLLYTSPSPRDQRGSRMPSSA